MLQSVTQYNVKEKGPRKIHNDVALQFIKKAYIGLCKGWKPQFGATQSNMT